MPFKKGHEKIPGSGRKRGSINKNTADKKKIEVNTARAVSDQVVEYFISGEFAEDLANVKDPKDKLLIMAKYANFVIPQRRAVDGSFDINTDKGAIDDTLAALAEENEH